MKKMMLIGMVVVMMLGLVGCNNEEKEIAEKIQNEEVEGFVPVQIEEESQEIADVVEEIIDTENLQKYYDVTQYVGEPRLENGLVSHDEEKNITMFWADSGFYNISLNDELVERQSYPIIIVDNNTPKDYFDDIVVYIFTE